MPPFELKRYRVECIITEIDEDDDPVDGKETFLDFTLNTVQPPMTALRNVLRNEPDDATVSDITT